MTPGLIWLPVTLIARGLEAGDGSHSRDGPWTQQVGLRLPFLGRHRAPNPEEKQLKVFTVMPGVVQAQPFGSRGSSPLSEPRLRG